MASPFASFQPPIDNRTIQNRFLAEHCKFLCINWFVYKIYINVSLSKRIRLGNQCYVGQKYFHYKAIVTESCETEYVLSYLPPSTCEIGRDFLKYLHYFLGLSSAPLIWPTPSYLPLHKPWIRCSSRLFPLSFILNQYQ